MNRSEWKFLILILIIFIAACIETDIYLPAFPDMMNYFSASEGAIQSLLTWNFVGICISCPFYGPLSDSFGRRGPLLIALGMFLAGSIITLFAQNFDHMLVGRVLQGLGSGGCFTLGTAVIFDAFRAEKVIVALNQLNTIVPFIMAGAPMLGGYLNHTYGFRSNFLAITLFVLISILISLFFFDETLEKSKRTPFQLAKVLANFKRGLTCWAFWQLTLVVSLIFTAYIAFLSWTAVLFVVEFGVSKHHFPFYQAAILGGWLVASLVCSRAIRKWGAQKVKWAGVILVVIGGVGFGVTALVAPRDPLLITLFMLPFAFGANWVNGLYFPECMEILPDIKGVTASLLTSARLLISAVIIGIVSKFYDGTIYPIVIVEVGALVTILPLIIMYERRKVVADSTEIAAVPNAH